MFYTAKSKEMCKELFCYALVRDQYFLSAALQVWVLESVSGRKKNSIGTSLIMCRAVPNWTAELKCHPAHQEVRHTRSHTSEASFWFVDEPPHLLRRCVRRDVVSDGERQWQHERRRVFFRSVRFIVPDRSLLSLSVCCYRVWSNTFINFIVD